MSFLIDRKILFTGKHRVMNYCNSIEFHISHNMIRNKFFYSNHFYKSSINYVDFSSNVQSHLMEGEEITYIRYLEEPKTKKITSDELYKYYLK